MRVGVIGSGSIGRYLAQAMAEGRAGSATLAAVCARSGGAELARTLGCAVAATPLELPALGVDLAVEAAGPEVVRTHAVPLLERGVNLMIMSVGALADPDLREAMTTAARATGARIYVPSGGIGGLDAVRGAAAEGIGDVLLTSRKPPRAWVGTETDIDVLALTEPAVIFEGPAEEAIRRFPNNVNISIALSLVGVGTQRTRVRVVADPTITANIHELQVSGTFGTLSLRLANRPQPDNPKTSLLAAQSALALLQRLAEPIQVGT